MFVPNKFDVKLNFRCNEIKFSINWYCKFGIFRENCIFANSVKDKFATLTIRHRARFTISVNDRVRAISRGFELHEASHMRNFAEIKSSRRFPKLQYICANTTDVVK